MVDQSHQLSQDDPEQAFGVFWGGPDRPARYLRDVLEERIHAVPQGGEILWATYYFRDEKLARALLEAHRRGVRVRVVVEGSPRTGAVNNRVQELLKGEKGLSSGFRALNHRFVDNLYLRRCRLHEKLYFFSHPERSVMVGTFNPSGNQPEDPTVVRKIGDQDNGHNFLVDIRDPVLAEGLYEHACRLFEGPHGPWERHLPENNRLVTSPKTRILFFPRSRWRDFNVLFDDLEEGGSLHMAVSHLNDRGICKRLFNLARRGVVIDIIAHDTKRRVPTWVEKQMLDNGVNFNRYVHPDGLPMHNKFMLFETPIRQTLAFGSMNLSVRSLHANHELLVVTEDRALFRSMKQRWQTMLDEISEFG